MPNRLRLIASIFLFLFSLASFLLGVMSAPTYYQRVVSGTVPTIMLDTTTNISNGTIAAKAAIRGMDLPTYAIYSIILSIGIGLIFLGVALLIILKSSGQWFLWFTAFILTFYPTGSFWEFTLVSGAADYSLFGSLLWPMYFLVFYLFPNGKAVPRVLSWPIGFIMILHLIFQSLAVIAFTQSLKGFIPDGYYEAVLRLAPLILLNFLLVLVAQVLRYRFYSNETERAQMRWVVTGLAIYVLFNLITAFLFGFGMTEDGGLLTDFGEAIALFLPITIGISVLRYRLWDIDVIIRRTLAYALLTAVLGVVYFGSVVLLQQGFVILTGQRSPLAIVLSTLAIAALFSPLRLRIQEIIDRRFFRQHYDAEKILAAFGARLRDEVDIEQVTIHLLTAVHGTVQPENTTLWIRSKTA